MKGSGLQNAPKIYKYSQPACVSHGEIVQWKQPTQSSPQAFYLKGILKAISNGYPYTESACYQAIHQSEWIRQAKFRIRYHTVSHIVLP